MKFEMNKCVLHRYHASKNALHHSQWNDKKHTKLANKTETKTAGNKFISLVEIKLYVYCFIFVS